MLQLKFRPLSNNFELILNYIALLSLLLYVSNNDSTSLWHNKRIIIDSFAVNLVYAKKARPLN